MEATKYTLFIDVHNFYRIPLTALQQAEDSLQHSPGGSFAADPGLRPGYRPDWGGPRAGLGDHPSRHSRRPKIEIDS